MASDCATAGASAFEQYKARLTGQYGELTSMLDQPEYHFNLRLNTCLMKVGHWSFIPFTERQPHQQDSDLLDEIIDVYANKTILSGGHTNRYGADGTLKSEFIGTNPTDFDLRAKRLMAE